MKPHENRAPQLLGPAYTGVPKAEQVNCQFQSVVFPADSRNPEFRKVMEATGGIQIPATSPYSLWKSIDPQIINKAVDARWSEGKFVRYQSDGNFYHKHNIMMREEGGHYVLEHDGALSQIIKSDKFCDFMKQISGKNLEPHEAHVLRMMPGDYLREHNHERGNPIFVFHLAGDYQGGQYFDRCERTDRVQIYNSQPHDIVLCRGDVTHGVLAVESGSRTALVVSTRYA